MVGLRVRASLSVVLPSLLASLVANSVSSYRNVSLGGTSAGTAFLAAVWLMVYCDTFEVGYSRK